MKVYDKIKGQNFIEIYPVNKDHLMTIVYGKNKNQVHLDYSEVTKLIKFMSAISEHMAINGSPIKDAITQV